MTFLGGIETKHWFKIGNCRWKLKFIEINFVNITKYQFAVYGKHWSDDQITEIITHQFFL